MAENVNMGGSLRQIVLPYPEFKLGEIIDPYEHNSNNSEMIIKINDMISVLNSFINGEANTNLSAMAVYMPGVEPIEGTDLETFLRNLIGLIRATTPGASGAHFVQSAKIEGLPGENVWEQVASLSELVTGLSAETGEPIDNDDEQQTTITGKLEALLRDFVLHKTGNDHDLRYYTKEEINNLLKGLEDNIETQFNNLADDINELRDEKLDEDGNFRGTWKGITLEKIMSASGTGFGMIEVLPEDPVDPEIGRIWIVSSQFEEE